MSFVLFVTKPENNHPEVQEGNKKFQSQGPVKIYKTVQECMDPEPGSSA